MAVFVKSIKRGSLCHLKENLFESIKILEMARGAFGVDLTIIVCVIGVCLRELKGI